MYPPWMPKSNVLGKYPVAALSAVLAVMFLAQPEVCVTAGQQSQQVPDHRQTDSATNRRFLSALAAYKAQQYAAAQSQLESLVKSAPGSFEVNELLGLVYVAQGKQERANPFLAKAVRLKPDVTEARTALATNLLALRRVDEAEIQFKKAAELNPRDYAANHNLGEFYVQTGRISDAIPFLQRAQDADPTVYNNGYDLALALSQCGKFEEARQQIRKLITLRDSAELHSLLGEIEEKSRNYISSAAQYEKAARMDPSERNILNWGAELLLHQTFVPAIEVFKAGTQRYPQSARLHNGLGIAFYGADQMDDAARAFFRAADLNPPDPLPMTFLGKTCDAVSADLAVQIRSRLQTFLERDGGNTDAHYYYAMCLWKTRPTEPKPDLKQVESQLKLALTLDPGYADAYFQLGVLYADQRKWDQAVEQYERALKVNANSANTHYRLGQALARLGNQSGAQEEFSVFERLRKNESDAANKQENQIQKFVYTMQQSSADEH